MELQDTAELTGRIIGAAIAVHRELGPGLLEVIYERALCIELTHLGLDFDTQVSETVRYRGATVGHCRVDLVVSQTVVVEIKSVDRLAGVHQAQLLAYMRILGLSQGLLLNFYGEVLRTGIKRLRI